MSISNRLMGMAFVAATALAAAGGCSADGAGEGEVVLETDDAIRVRLNASRSLAITAASVLEPCLTGGLGACGANGQSTFSLKRTLTTILSTANAASPSRIAEDPANRLARQLWDTHNTKANASFPGLPHCDDTLDNTNTPTLNGYPVQCPRNEGAIASGGDMLSRNSPGYFYPIGLFNRLDLRDAKNETCGEYRILYGRKTVGSFGGDGRALIIFEAKLPNPRPELGVGGCAPIAKMWADFSASNASAESVKATLGKFYYEGLTFSYPDGKKATTVPVMHFANLSDGRGQVRTNEFMSGGQAVRWQLREFKTAKAADGAVFFRPEYVKANPWPGLFANPTPSFTSWFVSQVGSLAKADINTFALVDDARFGAGQSDSHTLAVGPTGNKTLFSNDYRLFVQQDGALDREVKAELERLGSKLTARNIYDRASAQSCGGCHQHSNGDDLGGGIRWPASATFVHVNETPAAATGLFDAFGKLGSSFAISPALRDVFLPARLTDLSCLAHGIGCPAIPTSAEELRAADSARVN